jgi:two-component system chemotaxis response regulator CheB
MYDLAKALFIGELISPMNTPSNVLLQAGQAKPSTPRMDPEASFSFCKPPEAIVIGASTGGPQALAILLQGLAPFIKDVYVFVVLHTLTELMSTITHHLANQTSLQIQMGCHLVESKKGIVYFAPGDHHLGFVDKCTHIETMLSEAAPENFCRPSVDFLFRSAARCFGPRVLGIVLSGTGSDGLAGSNAIVREGGNVIVQDKASSVAWGMPGAVANKQLASAILPVNMIAPAIHALISPAAIGGLRDGL